MQQELEAELWELSCDRTAMAESSVPGISQLQLLSQGWPTKRTSSTPWRMGRGG